jgi:hypothetical protein
MKNDSHIVVDELTKSLLYFAQTFPNNQKNDLQVNHGLPGQILVRSQSNGLPIVNDAQHSFVRTKDQYAYFLDKPASAGNISNFAFGYAFASKKWDKNKMLEIMNILKMIKNEKVPDPDAIYAIQGYDQYFKDFPEP